MNPSPLGANLRTASAKPLKLAIVEDDPVVRQMLREYLCRGTDFTCVAVAASMEMLWAELDLCLPPDLLLLDISLPGQSGLAALPQLTRRLPEAGILVQTMHDEATYLYEALRAGAKGYVLKGVTPLPAYRQALLDIAHGGTPLSPSVARKLLTHFAPLPSQQPDLLSARERQVLEALVEGQNEKQVATRLGISPTTVHTYVGRLYEKLHVKNRAELLVRAAKGEL